MAEVQSGAPGNEGITRRPTEERRPPSRFPSFTFQIILHPQPTAAAITAASAANAVLRVGENNIKTMSFLLLSPAPTFFLHLSTALKQNRVLPSQT